MEATIPVNWALSEEIVSTNDSMPLDEVRSNANGWV